MIESDDVTTVGQGGVIRSYIAASHSVASAKPRAGALACPTKSARGSLLRFFLQLVPSGTGESQGKPIQNEGSVWTQTHNPI
jgi:hypothetical protein